MLDLQDEIKRAMAQGDRKVAKLTGAVRSTDIITVNVGDVFTIPEKYEAYETRFVGNDGKERVSPYIWVTLENGEPRKLFPSSLTRTRSVFNEDGTATGQRVTTEGTAVDEFKKHPTLDAAVDAIKGKKIKYTDKITVRTRAFGSGLVVDDFVPVFDFVA